MLWCPLTRLQILGTGTPRPCVFSMVRVISARDAGNRSVTEYSALPTEKTLPPLLKANKGKNIFLSLLPIGTITG
jgi:hypothetical protein